MLWSKEKLKKNLLPLLGIKPAIQAKAHRYTGHSSNLGE
jgi:hypothetical protein